ncbi:MAG: hypothetical protein WD894_14605 [Pirellulales bacterium]
MGFFAWLREGVRRAVLLGFSDAIHEIGNRNENDELGTHLAARWQQSILPEPSQSSPSIASPGGRKRLGKSLAQIREGGTQVIAAKVS